MKRLCPISTISIQLVGKRWNMLHKSNQLGKLEGLMAAGDIDYTDLETVFGAEYMVRRIDAIITYVRKLESIASIFPVRSNVQDKENRYPLIYG